MPDRERSSDGTDSALNIPAENAFRGSAGRRIFWRSWSPSGGRVPLGAVAIAHGYGEHSGRYDHVAQRLTAAGYLVCALDHHGHGRSGGKRGRISLDRAVTDLDQLIVTVIKRSHPEMAVFLLGHSMGGALALRYAMRHQERLRGLIVSAPLAEVDGSRTLKTFAKTLGRVLPAMAVSRVDPRLVSRDHEVVKDYIADPLNHHGPVPARVAREFIMLTDSLPMEVRRITVPTLLMWGSADRLCPPRGSQMVAAQIGSSDLTVKTYPGLFHEIMNEPERDQVLDDAVAWLLARSQPHVDRSQD